MKTKAGFVATALVSVLLICGGCGSAPQSANTATDVAAIHEVLRQIAATFDAGDYEAMLALYRDDVIVSAPGMPDQGRDEWLAGLRATLPPGSGMTLRFDTQELEVAGALAYERGTYEVQIPGADGAAPQRIGGRHIHIFKREADGQWKGWRLFENSADSP